MSDAQSPTDNTPPTENGVKLNVVVVGNKRVGKSKLAATEGEEADELREEIEELEERIAELTEFRSGRSFHDSATSG